MARRKLTRVEIAYLGAIRTWCECGSGLWVALLMMDTTESEWCHLVRFSRRADIPLAFVVKPHVDELLKYPWLHGNGDGTHPVYYSPNSP